MWFFRGVQCVAVVLFAHHYGVQSVPATCDKSLMECFRLCLGQPILSDLWKAVKDPESLEDVKEYDSKKIDETKESILAHCDELLKTMERHTGVKNEHSPTTVLDFMISSVKRFKDMSDFGVEAFSSYIEWKAGRQDSIKISANKTKSAFNKFVEILPLPPFVSYLLTFRNVKEKDDESVRGPNIESLEVSSAIKSEGLVKGGFKVLSWFRKLFKKFSAVYSEIRKECYNDRELLELSIIKGETPVNEKFLDLVMAEAKAGRAEACEYYREKMGPNAVNAKDYVADQFSLLLKAASERDKSMMPPDVRMIKSFSQRVLFDDMEPACLLYHSCEAGAMRANFKNQGKLHPGMDLLLGLLVSGRTDFNKFLDQTNVDKLGTPKIAEAVYKGYQDECSDYREECYRDQPTLPSLLNP